MKLIIKALFVVLVLNISIMFNNAHAKGQSEVNYYNVHDPFENMNRKIFVFNSVVDKFLLEPVARGYRFVTPDLFKQLVNNAFDNLGEPINFINSILQLDGQNALASFWRFVINSTLGAGGIMDVAGHAGLFSRDEDFGQTLAKYGLGSGAYIVMPLFGPSNVRDTAGFIVDRATDPFNYILNDEVAYVLAGSGVVAGRERILDFTDELQKTSLDPYSTLKSLYSQRRVKLISNSN